MSALLLLTLALPAAAVEVVADGPLEVERGTVLLSHQPYEVALGALLDVELRAAGGASTSIPRARLRADALVDTAVPVGMRLELDLSPFADAADNLNGPGLLRDAYLRLGVGNRRILDLGEIQLGQMRVPSSAESLRPPEHWRFTRRPRLERELLPGRDLGFVYHVDYRHHGWPLRVWLGSFAGAGPNRLDPALAPTVSARVELLSTPPRGGLQLVSGVAVVSAAAGPAPLILLVDTSLRHRRFNADALLLVADSAVPGWFDRSALRAELGVELLADFLELRLRHEVDRPGAAGLRQQLTVGLLAVYLDDAFQVLADLSLPVGPARAEQGTELALAFRLWW